MKKEPSDGVLDLIRALCVLAVLAGLTWYLTRHYGRDATKAASVLGVVAPVLAAVLGLSIGYSAGKVKGQEGKSAAVSSGRHQIVDHMLGLLERPQGGAEAAATGEDPRVTRMRDSLHALKLDAPDGQ